MEQISPDNFDYNELIENNKNDLLACFENLKNQYKDQSDFSPYVQRFIERVCILLLHFKLECTVDQLNKLFANESFIDYINSLVTEKNGISADTMLDDCFCCLQHASDFNGRTEEAIKAFIEPYSYEQLRKIKNTMAAINQLKQHVKLIDEKNSNKLKADISNVNNEEEEAKENKQQGENISSSDPSDVPENDEDQLNQVNVQKIDVSKQQDPILIQLTKVADQLNELSDEPDNTLKENKQLEEKQKQMTEKSIVREQVSEQLPEQQENLQKEKHESRFAKFKKFAMGCAIALGVAVVAAVVVGLTIFVPPVAAVFGVIGAAIATNAVVAGGIAIGTTAVAAIATGVFAAKAAKEHKQEIVEYVKQAILEYVNVEAIESDNSLLVKQNEQTQQENQLSFMDNLIPSAQKKSAEQSSDLGENKDTLNQSLLQGEIR